MKKLIIFACSLVLVLLLGFRIYNLTQVATVSETKIHDFNKEVELGKNFFHSSEEVADGYRITVLDSELLTLEEYTEKYDFDPSYINEEDESNFPVTHIYEVKVRLKNVSNDYAGEQGIDFSKYALSGIDYKLNLEFDAYAISNPTMEGSLGVSVEKGDEFDFVLPFEISNHAGLLKHIENSNAPFLQVSQYPVSNLLKID